MLIPFDIINHYKQDVKKHRMQTSQLENIWMQALGWNWNVGDEEWSHE